MRQRWLAPHPLRIPRKTNAGERWWERIRTACSASRAPLERRACEFSTRTSRKRGVGGIVQAADNAPAKLSPPQPYRAMTHASRRGIARTTCRGRSTCLRRTAHGALQPSSSSSSAASMTARTGTANSPAARARPAASFSTRPLISRSMVPLTSRAFWVGTPKRF